MSEEMIQFLSADLVTEALHGAGFRVESAVVDDVTVLRSATNGFAFEIRFANPQSDGSFADMSLLAALNIEGELPLTVVNNWNNGRRFTRLFVQGSMLVLSMDVSVLGGVAPAFLRTQLALWDRLVADLVVFLREQLAKPAA